ncbi:hypothetical protein [Streptomyces griseofuscus]|uniref:hypothetical protein n=1 Tax=Streptomyces griseofuscus TaxID=146922 RepID=UPI001FD548D2|nr:hypothetical protein [Streptomyces griseofuscus]
MPKWSGPGLRLLVEQRQRGTRGFLTGAARPAGQYEATDMRNADPRWQPGNFEKNVEAVDRLAEIAAARGSTVSQPPWPRS